jgi:hypothetical protein
MSKSEWCECYNRVVYFSNTLISGKKLSQKKLDALPCYYCGKPRRPKPEMPEKQC